MLLSFQNRNEFSSSIASLLIFLSIFQYLHRAMNTCTRDELISKSIKAFQASSYLSTAIIINATRERKLRCRNKNKNSAIFLLGREWNLFVVRGLAKISNKHDSWKRKFLETIVYYTIRDNVERERNELIKIYYMEKFNSSFVSYRSRRCKLEQTVNFTRSTLLRSNFIYLHKFTFQT